jgi:hypothetical protein
MIVRGFQTEWECLFSKIELEEARELTEAPLSNERLIMLKEIQTDYLEPQSISEQSTHEKQVHN